MEENSRKEPEYIVIESDSKSDSASEEDELQSLQSWNYQRYVIISMQNVCPHSLSKADEAEVVDLDKEAVYSKSQEGTAAPILEVLDVDGNSQSSGSTLVNQSQPPNKVVIAPEAINAETLKHDAAEPTRMFINGVPMPTTADPTVPDPTSVAHIPTSPEAPCKQLCSCCSDALIPVYEAQDAALEEASVSSVTSEMPLRDRGNSQQPVHATNCWNVSLCLACQSHHNGQ
ncbi:hypothetical protein WOLCODRAFT_29705 [Wolfiporia cocos MD-104 SS10]|uniref:Uncharacterized protein n=1 Tax=Wolfiporia cocos (strain MD-104) TaxID=742152 RepID=A0A2H3JI05_WOLCO|nr:hypothetical protein WOLCODRAFT_29705 [Wolfiporia cocos MD-104 SS10]